MTIFSEYLAIHAHAPRLHWFHFVYISLISCHRVSHNCIETVRKFNHVSRISANNFKPTCTLGSRTEFVPAGRSSPEMFANLNFLGLKMPYLIIYKKPQNTMKLKRRHGEIEQGYILSEIYTTTDALPPILPACRQPLLPACVFVNRDTVRHPRRFFFSENLFVMRGVREPRFNCSL
jgi:hypothetical protein